MAITAKMFGQFLMTALRNEVDMLNDDIKIMLTTSSQTLGTTQQDTFVYKDSITAEVTGTGYTAGGISLTNKSLTYSTSNIVTFDADDVEWTTATVTARYAVLYDNTPSLDADKPLIGYIDFGQDMIATAGLFRITFDSTGIFSVTIS